MKLYKTNALSRIAALCIATFMLAEGCANRVTPAVSEAVSPTATPSVAVTATPSPSPTGPVDRLTISETELTNSVELGGCNIKYSSSWRMENTIQPDTVYFYMPARFFDFIMVIKSGALGTTADDLHIEAVQQEYVRQMASGMNDFELVSCEATYIGDRKTLTVLNTANVENMPVNIITTFIISGDLQLSVSYMKTEEITENELEGYMVFMEELSFPEGDE